jgi:RNA processing factor Prp31
MSSCCCFHSSFLRSLSAWIKGSISRRLGSSAIESRADALSVSVSTENHVLIMSISSLTVPPSLDEKEDWLLKDSDAKLEVGDAEKELGILEEYEDMMGVC